MGLKFKLGETMKMIIYNMNLSKMQHEKKLGLFSKRKKPKRKKCISREHKIR